jgi:hypothetical protein
MSADEWGNDLKTDDEDTEADFFQYISRVFENQPLTYSSDVVVGSTSSDFYVESPTGSSSIFEVKSWKPTKRNIQRAIHLSSLYLSASGADYAFIVMPGSFDSSLETGVVSSAELEEFVEENVVSAPKKSRRKSPMVKPKPKEFIFASMPFANEYDDTFLVAMKPAAIELGYDCIRVDYEQFSGDIVVEIKELISKSRAVVADLSEARPNVLFEVGYAEALDKPVVQISTNRANLPFNVRNNKTLGYSIGQSTRLRSRLIKEFSGILL